MKWKILSTCNGKFYYMYFTERRGSQLNRLFEYENRFLEEKTQILQRLNIRHLSSSQLDSSSDLVINISLNRQESNNKTSYLLIKEKTVWRLSVPCKNALSTSKSGTHYKISSALRGSSQETASRHFVMHKLSRNAFRWDTFPSNPCGIVK